MDQEQSDIGPHCSSKRLLKHFSGRQMQTICVIFGALVVQKCLLRRFLRADKQIFLGEKKNCRLKKSCDNVSSIPTSDLPKFVSIFKV